MPPSRSSRNWRRYAAPTAFLAVASVAIVLVASALHGPTRRVRATTALTPTRTATTVSTTRPARTTTHAARRYYTVVAGDTFGVIAGKVGTTVSELEQLNPGVSSTALHVGQKLRVG